mmetsp:Transcript_44372/g.142140  ORF Transcript_44372/g.142140 Transcript_44372/m.142140 type:complete len:217 (+) Transcript_44372:1638-2288(+)
MPPTGEIARLGQALGDGLCIVVQLVRQIPLALAAHARQGLQALLHLLLQLLETPSPCSHRAPGRRRNVTLRRHHVRCRPLVSVCCRCRHSATGSARNIRCRGRCRGHSRGHKRGRGGRHALRAHKLEQVVVVAVDCHIVQVVHERCRLLPSSEQPELHAATGARESVAALVVSRIPFERAEHDDLVNDLVRNCEAGEPQNKALRLHKGRDLARHDL